MNALKRLQQSFAADLWGGELDHLQGLILDGRLPAARLLQVYRNNFQISLTEALAAIYPVVERLVGSDFFAFMAHRYLCAHPSRHGDLQQFGDRLAEFLGSFEPAAELPYLVDVARLEWAYHRVFHAPAATPFDPATLTQMPPDALPQLRFELGPACRLLDSGYPVFQIWQANQSQVEDPPMIDLESAGDTLLVLRPALQVELWRLPAANARLLQRLAAGEPLEATVEQVLAQAPDFELQPVLAGYLAVGVLIPDLSSDSAPTPKTTDSNTAPPVLAAGAPSQSGPRRKETDHGD